VQATPGRRRRHFAELTPDDFAATRTADGRAWIAALPALLADVARRWDLTVIGEEFRNGYNAVVFPVTRHGRVLALKLAWPADRTGVEAAGLVAWRSRGVVELVAADVPRGALLLERLDASRSLADVPLPEAAAIAGALIRTLAIDPPQSFPSLAADVGRVAATLPARQRALRDPVPARWLTMAVDLAATLSRDPERRLVHADLHYENVLASERPGAPWVAIDPDAATGAPERSVAELLWTRADELPGPDAITGLVDALVEHGRLDRAKAFAWAFVRTIDYWLWGLENGLTVDPRRCRRIAAALAPVLTAGK
jgi:streptomycin 6-kinase